MLGYSLLGEELTDYSTYDPQQLQMSYQHQTPQLPNHQKQHPNATSVNRNYPDFPLGVHSQAQAISSRGTRSRLQAQPGNVGGFIASFSGAGQPGLTFNQNQSYQGKRVMNDSIGGCGAGGEKGSLDLKVTGQQLRADRYVQDGDQALRTGGCVTSPEVVDLMSSHLSAIRQKIGQLQAIIPHFARDQQLANPLVHQHAAAMIAQLAQVATTMFPLASQQQKHLQQHSHDLAPFQSVRDSHPEQLSQQLFRRSVPPSTNLFRRNDPAGGMSSSGWTNGDGVQGEKDFRDLQGGGVNTTIGLSVSNLASQYGVDVDFRFQQQGDPSIRSAAPLVSPDGVQDWNFNNGQQSHEGMDGPTITATAAVDCKHTGSGTSARTGGEPPATSSHKINHGTAQVEQMCSDELLDEENVVGLREIEENVEEDGDLEVLPLGSYELVEMEVEEILAQNTHFCKICCKGFKRDANLRMHMRGHGDAYKSPAALRSRPDNYKALITGQSLRRYSCPHSGCKRNKRNPKFEPLKTVLCVKNHYRRIHCPKIHVCSKCKTRKFAVIADLKTHQKHCCCDTWQCSCGTTFSRKDKLLGHVALFVGHTPASLKMHELAMETCSGGLTNSEGSFKDSFSSGSVYGISRRSGGMEQSDITRGLSSQVDSLSPTLGNVIVDKSE